MKRWEAWCLRCLGGGKTIAESDAKRDVERAATSHLEMYGHGVEIIDRRKPAKGLQDQG